MTSLVTLTSPTYSQGLDSEDEDISSLELVLSPSPSPAELSQDREMDLVISTPSSSVLSATPRRSMREKPSKMIEKKNEYIRT